MQVVNTVRQVLTDPESRALYDRERRRFHDLRGSVAFRQRPNIPFTPVYSLPGPPSQLERYARATVVGVRVTVAELLPARCRGCRAVIQADERSVLRRVRHATLRPAADRADHGRRAYS